MEIDDIKNKKKRNIEPAGGTGISEMEKAARSLPSRDRRLPHRSGFLPAKARKGANGEEKEGGFRRFGKTAQIRTGSRMPRKARKGANLRGNGEGLR